MSRARRSTTTVAALLLGTIDLAAATETLAAGGDHTCVITTTGGVKCWGLNSKGQLGYQDTVKRTSPPVGYVDLGTGRTAVSITAGDAHTCVVLDDGGLKCWGYGNSGQLGQGDTFSYGTITWPVGGLPAVDLGTNNATGSARAATKAAAGTAFTCVLTEDGQVACFGSNEYGELGTGQSGDIGKLEADMGDNLEFVDFGTDLTGLAVDISSGPCALFSDGSVKCWGNNLYGSTGVPGSVDIGLADGDMGDSLPVVSLGGTLPATMVASGFRHNCVIFEGGVGGQVKCWGKNTQGNLGVGNVHDLGNDEGELGDKLDYIDLGAGAGSQASRMDGGLDHTCVVLTDGAVKCWGKNYKGALGLGDYSTRGDFPGEMGDDLPAVFLGTNRTAVEISCGDDFSCAVLDNGGVKCWGSGDQGKLGQGSSQQIGDDAGEMESLSAIDLGTGVLAAAPLSPFAATSSPTGAPTAAPTASPTASPATTAAPLGGSAGGETLPPGATGDASPSLQPASGANGDGALGEEATTTTPAPADGGVDEQRSVETGTQDSTADDVSFNKLALYIAAPLGAVILVAGGFAFYKRSRG